MSIEVQTNQPTTVGPKTETAIVAARPRRALWRRRSFQLAAGAVIAVMIAAFVANNLLSRQYSPEGAVSQYLSALQAGQADAAWQAVQVPAGDPSVTTLTDKAALKAALASGRPEIKSFVITGTTMVDSNSASVSFSYDTAGATAQGTLLAKRSGTNHLGVYPSWVVVVQPATLEITLPNGSGAVSVDGHELAAASAGKIDVAVLPVAHKVEFMATQMTEGQTVSVDMFDGSPRAVILEPKLTAAGVTKATATVKTAFDACAKLTSLQPSGCPQSFNSESLSSGQWVLLTDPTQDLAFSTDQSHNVVARGHFLMKFGFQQPGMDGTGWEVSGGGFQAQLVLSPDDIGVSSIKPASGLPGLARPSTATDDAAKAIVSVGMQACTRVTSGNPADCPQGWPIPEATNFSWKLNGDPMSGASVVFNQDSGLVTVHGNFSMTANYSIAGYPNYSHDSYTTTYDAYLYWDGQKLVLITIRGS